MMARGTLFFGCALLVVAACAHGGFLLEIDTDGLDDGVLTYNPGFSFGGDTTTASQSVTSPAYGTTGGDSIFGGDGSAFPDTYKYTYSPDTMSDNLVIPAGQDLGGGVLASGAVGGGPGVYSVYATWPSTANVSGGLTTFDVTTLGDSFSVQLDQNNQGGDWVKLGEINYTSGAIDVTQSSTVNSFVSMRAYGVLFEAVPEPATVSLVILGGLMFIRRRHH